MSPSMEMAPSADLAEDDVQKHQEINVVLLLGAAREQENQTLTMFFMILGGQEMTREPAAAR